jgi:serine/threonine-protein kinase
MGNYYNDVGDHNRALAEFERALQFEPASDSALLGAARAYENSNRMALAESSYKRATELRPLMWTTYSDLGEFYAKQSRYPEAISEVKKAVSLVPESARPLHQLGGIYYLMGRFDDASTALTKAVAMGPTASTFTNLGWVKFAGRDYEAAIANFAKAESMNPGYAQIGNLARAYYWAAGERKEGTTHFRRALAAADRVLQVNPKDSDALIMSASYHAMLGEKQPAFDALGKALTLQPRNSEYQFWAAIVNNQFGNREEALKRLELAASLGYSPIEIKIAPEFGNLHPEPRYKKLTSTGP